MDTTMKGAEEARKHLPDLLDAAERGEPTIITRHGKPVAALVPMTSYAAAKRQASILPLIGTGRGMWGKDSRQFMHKMRAEWGPHSRSGRSRS